MNKFLKGAVCAGLCLTMLGAVGCKKQSLDPEVRQLKLAIGALDGNFNPFFYTSQNDGDMISMTQIALLTNDEEGNIVWGDDQPTVAQSFTDTMYDVHGEVTQNGKDAVKTEYEFVIKKGIKFSDGVELTIKDVLFNLYVYLDPAYTGSSTIYSTDIQGLKAYRAQDPDLRDDDADTGLESQFLVDAQTRIEDLIYWSEEGKLEGVPSDPDLKADYDRVKQLFEEEAASDWTGVYGSWEESYKNTYFFDDAWKAYFFQEGLIDVQTRVTGNGTREQAYEDLNGNGKRDDGEKYYTTLDPKQPGVVGDGLEGEVLAQHYITAVNDEVTEEKIAEYLASHENSTREYAIEQLKRDFAVKTVITEYTGQRSIADVLNYWATGTEALNEFASDARTKYYDDIKKNNNGELLVKNISGITTYTNDDGYDVLKIVINGIDPKAKYNFSIPVTPMHYYSGTYEGKNYVTAANCVDEFGLEFGDSNFFKSVLQDTAKNGLPVGAGAYRCTNSRDRGEVTRNNFFENNVCYFVRNDYFETVAKNISNAKIKYVNYKVYSDDKIMTALTTQEIDFGTPNGNNTNQNEVTRNKKFLDSVKYLNGGYGYVGVNPKFVPEYKVRQAIMKSMNTAMTIGYYTTSLATEIWRPMSRTSWAYPEQAKEYPAIAYTTVDKDITDLVEEAGYEKQNGVYTKVRQIDGMANASNGTKLKLTFTIAGETTDHPAYAMFCEARDTLNRLGFDITVQTDLQALKKMTTGNLAVWAAAWTSASDPDMFQVYHKDSNATSVNNWNYKNILADDAKWSYEYNIIMELSDRIDDGRNEKDDGPRMPIYWDCLDMVMELAVELPTYQRSDLCVYNKNVIKASSLVQKASFHVGLFDKMWEIEYV